MNLYGYLYGYLWGLPNWVARSNLPSGGYAGIGCADPIVHPAASCGGMESATQLSCPDNYPLKYPIKYPLKLACNILKSK